jgi:hypothetical protein
VIKLLFESELNSAEKSGIFQFGAFAGKKAISVPTVYLEKIVKRYSNMPKDKLHDTDKRIWAVAQQALDNKTKKEVKPKLEIKPE